MTNQTSTVTEVAATERGALDGFAFRCSICEQTFTSSQRSLAELDAEAHAAWHVTRGDV